MLGELRLKIAPISTPLIAKKRGSRRIHLYRPSGLCITQPNGSGTDPTLAGKGVGSTRGGDDTTGDQIGAQVAIEGDDFVGRVVIAGECSRSPWPVLSFFSRQLVLMKQKQTQKLPATRRSHKRRALRRRVW